MEYGKDKNLKINKIQDSQTIDEPLNKKGCALLATAVVKTAVYDWKRRVDEFAANPADNKCRAEVESVERFFKGEWYSVLHSFAPEQIPIDMLFTLKSAEPERFSTLMQARQKNDQTNKSKQQETEK